MAFFVLLFVPRALWSIIGRQRDISHVRELRMDVQGRVAALHS